MGSCSNCYNGCTEITSDKCVKYTGIDIPLLGISNGDSLSYIEQTILNFLVDTVSGLSIKPEINSGAYCQIVSQYLPDCGAITLVDILTATINAACAIQTEVINLNSDFVTLEGDYNIGCLSSVSASSGTHIVLQSVITKLCTINTTVNQLLIDLPITYVKVADIDTYISTWFNTKYSSTLIKNKMVPYVAVPYFGPLDYFNAAGSGTGDWINIYLCNGDHGTPDLRGRVIVSRTDITSNRPYDAAVDPANPANPIYEKNTRKGDNNIVLTTVQIPSHTHTTTATIVPFTHSHLTVYDGGSDVTLTSSVPIKREAGGATYFNYSLSGTDGGLANTGKTSEVIITPTVNISNGSTGGGNSHSNIQPVYAACFIMYIP